MSATNTIARLRKQLAAQGATIQQQDAALDLAVELLAKSGGEPTISDLIRKALLTGSSVAKSRASSKGEQHYLDVSKGRKRAEAPLEGTDSLAITDRNRKRAECTL